MTAERDSMPLNEVSVPALEVEVDPSRKSGGALHRLHCFCLEFDGACEVQRRVPTGWIIEPIDVCQRRSKISPPGRSKTSPLESDPISLDTELA